MLKRIIIPLLLILFMASMAAFGAPTYVNVGPTTEFDGDIKILSEIVAEGVTPDDWETTVLFTDPTADRTITIPDSDQTIGTSTTIAPVAIHGLDADTLADADEFVFYDETGAHINKITWTNLQGSITSLSGMSGAIATPTNISMTGELDMTGANALIDLNPAQTGTACIINITPTATIAAASTWDGICIDGDALDPLAGAFSVLHGFHVDFSGVLSADGDDAVTSGTYVLCPTGDTAISWGHAHVVTELTVAGTQIGFGTLGATLALSATATYRGIWVDWDGITRDANAPILEGMRIELPADYTAFGANFGAYFSGGGETVTICNGTYALNISGDVVLAGALTGLTTPLAANLGGTGVANNAASTITISGNYGTTFTVSNTTALTLPTSGTVATTSNKLSAFAATTSAELAGVISDEIGAGKLRFDTSVTAKTTTATLTAAEAGLITATVASAYSITLPTAVGNIGLTYTIKKTDNNTNLVTVDGNAAETIDGELTYTELNYQYAYVTFVSDNSNWLIISESTLKGGTF